MLKVMHMYTDYFNNSAFFPCFVVDFTIFTCHFPIIIFGQGLLRDQGLVLIARYTLNYSPLEEGMESQMLSLCPIQ